MIDDLVIATPSSKITALVSELNVPTILTKFTSDISELYQSTITQTLNVLKKNQNSNYDYIVIMNPTSPLLLSEDIDNTIKKSSILIPTRQSSQLHFIFSYGKGILMELQKALTRTCTNAIINGNNKWVLTPNINPIISIAILY